MFVLCHSLRIILNLDELLNLSRFKREREKGCHGIKFWVRLSLPINSLMIIFNSSANFIIYVLFDRGFQQVLRHIFTIRRELPIDNTNEAPPMSTARTRRNDTTTIHLTSMN